MRKYEYVLPRPGKIPRTGVVQAPTAKVAKRRIVNAAGWSHCFWTICNTKIRWIR